MKKTIAVVLVSMAAGSFATLALAEKQPQMHKAVQHLEQGLAALRNASADKGGHRAKAIDLVEAAIRETRAGIAYDNAH